MPVLRSKSHEQIPDKQARFLTGASVAAAGLGLSGCDAFNGVSSSQSSVRRVLEKTNDLTYRVQRLLQGRNALAQEFTEADIRQPQKANGVTNPQDEGLQVAARQQFCRLAAGGDRSGRESRCLSRWRSCRPCPHARRSPGTIALRAGAASPNGPAHRCRLVLDQASRKAARPATLFHCMDTIERGSDRQHALLRHDRSARRTSSRRRSSPGA
jgi:hypothetical protein